VRILVVDDDQAVRRSIDRALRLEGYEVATVPSGGEALESLAQSPPDALILDLGLPDVDGLTVCRRMRSAGDDTPVLMLTARDAVEDRVNGLDSGADDYLIKPFSLSELRARLRALMRRESSDKAGILSVADLSLDPATHRVLRSGQEIQLTTKEYALLEYFMRNPDRLITREMAESHIWSYDFEGTSNVVDVYIRRLRRKIDDPFPLKLFETVRGAGYRLCRVPGQG